MLIIKTEVHSRNQRHRLEPWRPVPLSFFGDVCRRGYWRRSDRRQPKPSLLPPPSLGEFPTAETGCRVPRDGRGCRRRVCLQHLSPPIQTRVYKSGGIYTRWFCRDFPQRIIRRGNYICWATSFPLDGCCWCLYISRMMVVVAGKFWPASLPHLACTLSLSRR